jgi:aminopeptidase N
VNRQGSGDMYYKAGNMLHMIRSVINDDEKFRQILRGLNKTYYHKTVAGKDIEAYISQQSGKDFSSVFDQYLRSTKIPVLEYEIECATIRYRFINCNEHFTLPVKVNLGQVTWLTPTTSWKKHPLNDGFAGKTLTIDRNFYIQSKKTN